MIIEIIETVIIVLSAIILHECAHGWMAYKLGDPTAKLAGRLTLNPIKHIDPVGTLLLPGALIALKLFGVPTIVFGWAKPVPVNFFRLNHPKRDMIFVALAGPATNIILAVVFSEILKSGIFPNESGTLKFGVFVNLLLAAFNMLPIPPLDGSRLVAGILPDQLAAPYMRLEPYGILIVFVLLYFDLLDRIVLPFVVVLAKLLGVYGT